MREALGLLTVLGGSRTPTPRALRWFPVVGAALGGLVGSVWWLADRAFTAFLAASLAIVADLALTGMLHYDGLADAADGLLPHASRERRLAIMRAPDVGAFGIAAVGAVLLVRTAAFAGQPADVALVAAFWCASRTIVALALGVMRYARDTGMASPLLEAGPARWGLVVALLPAAALAFVADGGRGAVAMAALVVAAAGILVLARRRIGGYTGDVLGATIVVAETVALVVTAARW
jgi:adenosylcobinamide-GDP ribazoletransferase